MMLSIEKTMEKATKKVRGILANPEEFSYLCVRKK